MFYEIFPHSRNLNKHTDKECKTEHTCKMEVCLMLLGTTVGMASLLRRATSRLCDEQLLAGGNQDGNGATSK